MKKLWKMTIAGLICLGLLLPLSPVLAGSSLGGMAVGWAESTEDPGIVSFGSAGKGGTDTLDWAAPGGYYYLENDYAKYVIGTKTVEKDLVNYSKYASQQGSLAAGTMVDGFPKANARENLDYSEFVLRKSSETDLRNWWYPNDLLVLPEIDANQAAGTVTASGGWAHDQQEEIKASVVYSMVEGSPLLKMEVTLTNEGNTHFTGDLGYVIDYNESGENNPDRCTYIPGIGWKNGDAAKGTQLTAGWTEGYVMIGQKDKYTGYPVHAVLWDQKNQDASAVIPKFTYTGAWFSVDLAANGGSQTITFYHLVETPASAAEPYAAASLWASRLADGDFSGLRAVSGTVRDTVGTPLAEAEVSISDGVHTYRFETDARGRYYGWIAESTQTYTVAAQVPGIYQRQEKGLGAAGAALSTVTDFALEAREGPTELPSDSAAVVSTPETPPAFTYATDACDNFQKGDLLLENAALSVLLSAGTGAPAAVVPAVTGNASLECTELVLQGGADAKASHPGAGFTVTGTEMQNGTAFLRGTAEDTPVSASFSYSAVENAPLVKVKVRLKNNGVEAYQGSFGYLFTPGGNGRQTYLPGTGWIGDDPAGLATRLVTPSQTANYLYNGSLGKQNDNTAHALLWFEGGKPAKLVFSGGHTGAWWDVHLDAGGEQELVFYHMAQPQGDRDHPLDATEFWAEIVRQAGDPAQVGVVTGTVASGGQPSPGVVVSCGGQHTASLADGSYTLYTIRESGSWISAFNGVETSPAKVDFDLEPPPDKTRVSYTYGDPEYVYNPGAGLRDWYPTNPYYSLENDYAELSIYPKRTSVLSAAAFDDYSPNLSGNNKWGSLNAGGIADAVSKQNRTENLDWSAFVLFPERPEGSTDRNYLGATSQDEAANMYMEWSWWFPANKLELPNIQAGTDSLTASGAWEGGIAGRKDIDASVRYSFVDNSPLVRMEITLKNKGNTAFRGNFAYVLDPDMEGEQHSYVPGVGWEYSQTNEPVRQGWTENYIFDGFNGFSGNAAHAILWPETQQPNLLSSQGGWINAWFTVEMDAAGETELTIYYLPHTPGGADAPYAVAEYWAQFLRAGGDAAQQGAVTGTVLWEDGAPMAGAQVELTAGGQPYYSATTDAGGRFTLFAAAGEYSLDCQNAGFEAYSQPVSISGGERLEREISLRQYVAVSVRIPENVSRGENFQLEITLENTFGTPLNGMSLRLEPPETMELSVEDVTLDLHAGEKKTLRVEALALAGGRRDLCLQLTHANFEARLLFPLDLSGAGYYGGDNHTHSVYSDGVDTVEENADSVYENRNMSWIWASEHNNNAQAAEAARVTGRYAGRFLALSATELTTGYTHNPTTPSGEKRGHALIYGLDAVPNLVIDQRGGVHDWQASIDEITEQNGLFWLAHPFDATYPFEDAATWSGYTGVEVWNGSVHASHPSSRQAFQFWDRVNLRGERHYYGTAGTDGHTSEKVGGLGVRGRLEELTGDEVLRLLKEGAFYGTNGPDLRFSVNGAPMGGTVTLSQPGRVNLDFQAYTQDGTLTGIRLLGYRVTGDETDYETARTVLLDLDLTGEDTQFYQGAVQAEVPCDMFFRMEVKSTTASGTTGAGPETGTGFAFSNPVWVELTDTDTSRRIERIFYNGTELTPKPERFGVTVLEIDGAFYPEKLSFQAGGAQTSNKVISQSSGLEQLVDVTVTAGGGSAVTSYLVRATEPPL